MKTFLWNAFALVYLSLVIGFHPSQRNINHPDYPHSACGGDPGRLFSPPPFPRAQLRGGKDGRDRPDPPSPGAPILRELFSGAGPQLPFTSRRTRLLIPPAAAVGSAIPTSTGGGTGDGQAREGPPSPRTPLPGSTRPSF